MRLDIDGDKLYLKNDHAGCMWIFFTFLFLPFIFGIYFLWQEPRDAVPLYFVIPFTVIFLIAAPIMLREAVKMRIVTLQIDRTVGEVEILKSIFFSKEKLIRKIDEIDFMEVEHSDNDGDFFNVSMFFKDGYKLAILHGSHKESIYQNIHQINDFIKVRYSEIPLKEIEV